jgi:hypothetical protein
MENFHLCIETEIEKSFVKQWARKVPIFFANSVAKKETFVIMPLLLNALNYDSVR